MPHGISIGPFQKFVKEVVCWPTAIKKGEHTSPGNRIEPTNKSKDALNNFRIDTGRSLEEGKYEMILQANKNAEYASVKKAAQADSPQIVAKAIADPKDDPHGEKAKEELEKDFHRR